MAMMQQFVKALQDDYVDLKDNLYLLWCQASNGRPQGKETHQPSPPSDSGQEITATTTAGGSPIPAETKGRPAPLRTPSSRKATLVRDWEELMD